MNVKYEEPHPDVFAGGGGCALSPLRALSPLAIVIFLEQWEKPRINSENPLEAFSVPPGFSLPWKSEVGIV